MSICGKCRSQLPANAEHCVFCGSPNLAAPPSGNPAIGSAEQPKSTMMGHPGMLDELQHALEEKQRLSPDFGGDKTIEAESPQAARNAYNQSEQGFPPPQMQMQMAPVPPQISPATGPQIQQTPQPHLPVPQQHQVLPPGPMPPQYQPAPGPMPGLMPPQQQQYQPVPSPVSPSPLGSNFGMEDARFGAEAGQAVPPIIPYRESLTEKVAPLPAPDSLSDANTWDESLITVLLVLGVVLIACFVAPWSIGEDTSNFAWTILSTEGASVTDKIAPMLILSTGLAAIGTGVLQLTSRVRAFVAICIGICPIGFTVVVASPFDWRSSIGFLGTILIVSGLHLRSRYDEQTLPRALVTFSALLLLTLYFVPIGGKMPVMNLLDLLSDSPGASKVLPIVGFSTGNIALGILPFTVILLTLLVWMPGSSPAIMISLAVVLLFGGLFAALTGPLLAEDIFATLKTQLSSYLFLPLAATAWVAITSYGLRTLLDHRLRVG